MFTETEIAQRESVGMNVLWEDPINHCPDVPLHEIISRAILGSPRQRLGLGDIYNAIQERFRYVVLQDCFWLVSGIILLFGFELFPKGVSVHGVHIPCS